MRKMRNRGRLGLIVVLISIILLVSIVFAADVEPEVLEKIEEEGEVSVIVILEEEEESVFETLSSNAEEKKEIIGQTQDKVLDKLDVKETAEVGPVGENYDLELERKFSTVNGFSGTVTEEGLKKLEKDPNVKNIVINKILKTSLSTSVPQINGNDVWNLSAGGYNITGELESVCIIDSGIQTNHTAFATRIKAQHCFCSLTNSDDGLSCCPDDTSEDLSAEDDYGHGTHVAGIAAGNLSTHQGMATGAGIVVVKVCNAAGSCATADVISAIEYCTNNATTYNISVISLSMGDSSQYNDNCDDEDGSADINSTAAAINSAVGKNISVVISSGNYGYTGGIAFPACITNATPVGGVNSVDAIIYNRADILNLLAPAVSITAPYFGTSITTTSSQSGTSMAAPHVSGAIALLRQYWRLAYSMTPTPAQVEYKLTISGKIVADLANEYYRVDIMSALQPFVNYSETSVDNDTITGSNNTFINLTSDVNLTNALLEWHYSNGTVRNVTMDKLNGTGFYLNVTHLVDGNDHYRIYGNDTAKTVGVSGYRNITLDATLPEVNITNPLNNSNFSSGNQAFNITVDEINVDSVRFSFDNATGTAFNVTPTNRSGNWGANLDLSRLGEGSHTITALVNDSAGNNNNSQIVQFIIDRTAPNITKITPLAERNYTIASSNQTFNVSVRDTNLSIGSVLFSFDNASGTAFNVTAANQSGYWTASFNVSQLADGSHIVTIIANDSVGNLNNTESFSFSVDGINPNMTLNSPTNNYYSASTSVTFNCTGSDDIGLVNITLYGNWSAGWHANETLIRNGTSNETTFSKTLSDGSYLWNCLAYDEDGNTNFSVSNFTLTVDTVFPNVTSVSSGTPDDDSTTITWTTSESANSSVHYGTAKSLGSSSTSLSLVTSHSRTLSSLSASTTYYFNVTSCDSSGNCNTTDGGSFATTAASSSSDSSSSSSSSGGGGGGGSSTTSAAAAATETTAEEEVEEEEEAVEEVTEVAEVEEVVEELVAEPGSFTQSATITSGEEAVVSIESSDVPISEMQIRSKVDKEVIVTIKSFTEKPEEVEILENAYKFLDMDIGLTDDEFKKVLVTFTVPQSWLDENNLTEDDIDLFSFSDGEWDDLSTKVIDSSDETVSYQAKVKHFSYFAIAGVEGFDFGFLTGWMTAIGDAKLGSKIYVLVGLAVLIGLLVGLYVLIKRKIQGDDVYH